MFFLMRCLHHPGQDAARDQHRPAHRVWVRTGGGGLAAVLVGSALLDEVGASMGNFGTLEAADGTSARPLAAGDPLNRAGIVAEIELTPLLVSFQAHRTSEPT